MQPRGPLMVEHRLIERMIGLMDKEVTRISEGNALDHGFIREAVDFIRTYADRKHHGKEEEILFYVLAEKNLSESDRLIMEELIQEHVAARAMVASLVAAAAAHEQGDATARMEVTQTMRQIAGFYPPHIAKEDSIFFPAAMAYLSVPGQQSILNEFREFDSGMIHEKYRAIVSVREGEASW